jgi:hypothetical protein
MLGDDDRFEALERGLMMTGGHVRLLETRLADRAAANAYLNSLSFIMLLMYTLLGLATFPLIAPKFEGPSLEWAARLPIGILGLSSVAVPSCVEGMPYVRHLTRAEGMLSILWIAAGIIWAPTICRALV